MNYKYNNNTNTFKQEPANNVSDVQITLNGIESLNQLEQECKAALDIIVETRKNRVQDAKEVYMQAVLSGDAPQIVGKSFEEFIRGGPGYLSVSTDQNVFNFVRTVNMHGLNAYSVKYRILHRLMRSAKFAKRYQNATLALSEEDRKAIIIFTDESVYDHFEKRYQQEINKILTEQSS